jgi:hypothetical protein
MKRGITFRPGRGASLRTFCENPRGAMLRAPRTTIIAPTTEASAKTTSPSDPIYPGLSGLIPMKIIFTERPILPIFHLRASAPLWQKTPFQAIPPYSRGYPRRFFPVPHSALRIPRSEKLPNEPILASAICPQTKEKITKCIKPHPKNEPIPSASPPKFGVQRSMFDVPHPISVPLRLCGKTPSTHTPIAPHRIEFAQSPFLNTFDHST